MISRKRRKRRISKDTSQTARNLNKPVPTSTAVKLPSKAVLTHDFFASLRTTDMDTETTGAENALPEQKASRKLGRPPTVRVSKYMKRNPYCNKRNGELFSHEILP
jgi:hypothetical protein